MIRISGLRKTYPPDREVLLGIDLEVAEGAFISIVGRSGSGKTTLLNIAGGLDTRYEGTVEVAGRVLGELGDAKMSDLRNSTIGYLFQAYHLLDHLSVAENASLPWLFARGGISLSPDAARRRAERVLNRVGLRDRARSRPSRLSGGERQRLALARALYHRPRLLLCDEPTGNLDSDTGAEVVDLLRAIHRESGMTVVVATHDESISDSADRVLRLREGVLEAAT
jgi:ABC-type lipoprotein export system ATPase subunit